MKLIFTLIVVGCLSVSASVRSQDVRMSLNVKDAAISKVIKAIEKSTPYKFVYNNNLFPADTKVDVVANNISVANILNSVLQNTGFTYQVLNNNLIVLTKSDKISQVQRISGIVTDQNDLPLPGVTVRLKLDKNSSTATDINGHFHIDVNNPKDMMIFNFIGYNTLELPIPQGGNIRVKMVQATNTLNEVQYIGYGTTTKRANTGAVSSITAVDLGKETVTNPLTALQGRIAGMQITQDNGLPGAGVRVNIRGAGSASTGGLSYYTGFAPLYIIDGVPFTLVNASSPPSDNLNAAGTSGASGAISPFSIINPEDIDRIDVLKDADATAIYGSRGANGVVLITTKKGTKGRTVVNVNAYQGIEKVGHFLDMMNTQQYLAMRKEAFANAGVTPTASNALDLTVWDQNAYTDWQKYFIGGTSNLTNATATVSGGSAQNTFLFSSTYRKEGTVFPGDYSASTYSSRLNAGHKSENNRFNIDLSVSYTYMNNNLPNTDLSTLYSLPPNYPLYNANGSANWTLTNPLSYFLKQYAAQTANLLSNLNLGYTVLPGLKLKANLGYTLTTIHQTNTNPASSQNPATANSATTSSLIYTNNATNNFIVEPQAEYQKVLGKGNLNLVVGTTFQHTKSDGLYLTGTGFNTEALINSIFAASSITSSNYNNYSEYNYNAFFGRLNYTWNEKYIVDGTFRRDGSSKFGPAHRFGNFGALGAAWIFTQESFLKPLDFLSFGKLRASYGTTGNDQIPSYQYIATDRVVSGTSTYQGNTILVQSNIANPDLHWETTKKFDAALELGFLKDRILLKTDFYRNRTSGLLTYQTLPAQTTYNSVVTNLPAVVQNQGWEFELNTINIVKKDLRWTSSINLTFNRSKLISYPNLATSSYSSSYFIGMPLDLTMLYHFTGVNPQTGLPTFQTANGTPNYSTDRIPAPYGHPYYGGISNTITYKSFQLDFTFQFNHRNGFLNNTLTGNYSPYGYTYANQSVAVLNRWRNPGDVSPLPMASVTPNSLYSTLASSDYNWGDASYIKFKTLSLSYSLPKQWVKHIGMSSVSVYGQGQNLLTWAKQKYTYDPETTLPGTGVALGTGNYIAFPQLRTMVLGLNCSF
ncbi:SusC/RagA family TonB-linked outer membrane protein [Mucilaginibacter paludis]|nr:SusC/RagA family TonB-linked outer membrane protein [Mucilaginibacter paludis]